MAEMHFDVSVDGRASGRSAAASAAYRSGQKITCVITGETFDYSYRKGVEEALILGPFDRFGDEEEPWWMDRERLWAEVELAEKRKDAQLFREVTISLPHELDADERRELLLEFAQEQFVALGMVADVAIHAADERGQNAQPHAHVMLTLRPLDGAGFSAKKDRSWNDRALVGNWRKAWEVAANRALEAAGHDARINAGTLEERREALLAQAAEEADEVRRLRIEAQAEALNYIPQPRLDAPVWRSMAAGEDLPEYRAQIEAWREAVASKQEAQGRAAQIEALADEIGVERAADAQRAAKDAVDTRRAQEAQKRAQEAVGRRLEAQRAAEAQRAQEAREAALRASERAEAVTRIARELAETFPTPADPGPWRSDPFSERVFAHHLHSHGAPDPTADEIRDGWRQVIDRWFERICAAVAEKVTAFGVGSLVPEAWRGLLSDERSNRLLDGSDPLARIIETPEDVRRKRERQASIEAHQRDQALEAARPQIAKIVEGCMYANPARAFAERNGVNFNTYGDRQKIARDPAWMTQITVNNPDGTKEKLPLWQVVREIQAEEAAAVRERNKSREPEQPKPSQPRKPDDPTPGM